MHKIIVLILHTVYFTNGFLIAVYHKSIIVRRSTVFLNWVTNVHFVFESSSIMQDLDICHTTKMLHCEQYKY